MRHLCVGQRPCSASGVCCRLLPLLPLAAPASSCCLLPPDPTCCPCCLPPPAASCCPQLVKESDPALSGDHVREGLSGVISVKVPSPEFEGQTKTRLGNPEVRPTMVLHGWGSVDFSQGWLHGTCMRALAQAAYVGAKGLDTVMS
jgi:hypothetical protein